MARVLIAGCGYVGTRAALDLARAGHTVFGLRRDPSSLPEPIQPVAADFADPTLESVLPEGVEGLIYAVSPGERGEAAYRRAYVDGPLRILAALDSRGARLQRAVLVSSTAVYGQSHGEAVDEDSTCEPERPTARIVCAGERSWLEAAEPTCVLRLGGIYGPGRERLIRQVRAGDVELPPEPSAFTNRIHRDDAAGIAAHLLALDPSTHAGTAGSQSVHQHDIYNGVDTEAARMGTVLRWLAERVGVELVESQAAEAHPSAAPPSQRPAGSADRTPGMNKRVLSERIRQAGYRFRYPTFREGYGSLLEA